MARLSMRQATARPRRLLGGMTNEVRSRWWKCLQQTRFAAGNEFETRREADSAKAWQERSTRSHAPLCLESTSFPRQPRRLTRPKPIRSCTRPAQISYTREDSSHLHESHSVQGAPSVRLRVLLLIDTGEGRTGAALWRCTHRALPEDALFLRARQPVYSRVPRIRLPYSPGIAGTMTHRF